ncbi:MAG TPA: hypothetical protein VGC27_00655, partial [Rhizomicrobium sp.]
GFLGGPTPVSVQTVLFMSKTLTMKRFSNFESATVKDPTRLASALRSGGTDRGPFVQNKYRA